MLVGPYLPLIGGTEVHVQRVGQWLTDHGVEVLVIQHSLPDDEIDAAPKELADQSLPIIHIREGSAELIQAQIARIIRERFLSVVHAHSRDLSLLALRAKQNWQIPLVVSLHNTWPLTPTLQCLETCEGYVKTLCSKCTYPHIKDPYIVVWQHSSILSSLENADAIISPSRYEAQRLIAANPKLERKLFAIPTGVDIETFHRRNVSRSRYGLPSHANVVLYCGRIR